LIFRGIVYRAHHPHWAFDPLSGAGAARHGGRFNRVGQPALYTSLSLNTAWLEAQQGFVLKAQPMTICSYRIECDGIEDLRDPSVLNAHGIALADLECPWEAMARAGAEPPSWILADLLMARGVSGIMVPSFAYGAGPNDHNLIFWTWSDQPPHQVALVDDHGRLTPMPD
jgi:RES domain-containing protein